MTKLRSIGPAVRVVDTRSVKPPPKVSDPWYSTADHAAWRKLVVERAGHRCEAVENGRRCHRTAPEYRLYADHRTEISDDPRLRLDPANGKCLCASHHVKKTNVARADRVRVWHAPPSEVETVFRPKRDEVS